MKATTKKLFLSIAVGYLMIAIVSVMIERHLRNPGTISEITLEHDVCFLPCAVDQVTFHPNGATFVGVSNTSMIGTYESNDADLRSLARAMQQNRLLFMHDNYDAGATDQESVLTSIVCSRGRKTINDYGGADPPELIGLENQIDATVARAHWHKVSNSTHYSVALVVSSAPPSLSERLRHLFPFLP
jgi:hypothetical protein